MRCLLLFARLLRLPIRSGSTKMTNHAHTVRISAVPARMLICESPDMTKQRAIAGSGIGTNLGRTEFRLSENDHPCRATCSISAHD